MKRIFALILAVIMLALTVSCSSKKTESEKVASSMAPADLKKYNVVTFDMTQFADDTVALTNPDKGWYVHYYDNSIEKYGVKYDVKTLVKMIPCLDHIYLRLAWSYLEPQEGKFKWDILDKIIDQCIEENIGVSFRITCKETNMKLIYATPEWVKNAGAAGTMLDNAWEPDYGDPIFLEKLRNFHKAFAERYASKPYVRYIDVGSYGDWGEGHTASSSHKDWPWSTIKAHFDIYNECYPDDLIVVSDDFIGSRGASEGKAEIKKYVTDHGWTYRDDSISVKWFHDNYGEDTLRSPELFNSVYATQPTILELEHYHKTIEQQTFKKGVPFMKASERVHCTYAGFHGDPVQWMTDNRELNTSMGNKLGYWYFINNVKVTRDVGNLKLKVSWQNKGMSRAYYNYGLTFILTGADGVDHEFAVEDFDNTKIQSGASLVSDSKIDISSLESGKYTLSLRLNKGERAVLLAVNADHTGADGRCIIGDIEL